MPRPGQATGLTGNPAAWEGDSLEELVEEVSKLEALQACREGVSSRAVSALDAWLPTIF